MIGILAAAAIAAALPASPPAATATNADPAEFGRWLDDRFLPPDVLDWPLNVVVVRSGGRTISSTPVWEWSSPAFRGQGRRSAN